MVLTDDAPNDSMDTGKQQDTESDDGDDDGELVMVMDGPSPNNDVVVPSNDDDDMDSKKTLKLATLAKIKSQLDDIHTSHQRILALSLYFNDNDVQHHDNDASIQDLVKQAGLILEQLDQHKQSEWERHSSTSASSVGSESDDGDDDNKDFTNDATSLTDHFVLMDPLANATTHDDDDKASSVTSDNDNDNDMAYELMQDVDGDGFLILNL
ncbi:hypothetical protein BCR42DRAFT_409084 [Absidia repens]|uniref:Uncharacterized protein n=1 Tax=Absidia repens TaxID=90262 RepID=A0A1X2IQQ1_9FUNG|nr:hypothetical protein BCR42DRAFT_409084 [Absidia repens]